MQPFICKARKRDYDWRATAFDRAMEAGIDDVGIGALFGLYDWRFEILSMMQHIRHLEERFGVGPHTISFPRIEPAVGSEIASHPPYAVSDTDFMKMIAIMRLAVPYTGMIMSTRENAEVRRETFALGISQISAGSRTDPGGYKDGEGDPNGSQFQLGDHRSVEEVVTDVVSLGYTPSFCTACYRTGRTGPGLHGPGQARRNQVSLPAQRALDISRVFLRLRMPGGEIRRRKTDLDRTPAHGRPADGLYPAHVEPGSPRRTRRFHLEERTRKKHHASRDFQSFRLHIGFFGRRNVGKSSLLNAITKQNVSIVSEVAGTTTDPVEKPMELLPIGPVLFVDTAGVDDVGALGAQRIEKTRLAIARTDMGVLVTEAGVWGKFEEHLLAELRSHGIPVLVALNKADLRKPSAEQLVRFENEKLM